MNVDKQALRQTAEKAQEHGVFNMDMHSQTVLALLDKLEAKDKLIIQFQQKCEIDPRTHQIIDLEERIAELETQRAVVTLPAGYSVRPGHPINETERSVMIPKDGGQWLSRFDVEHALRVAGIRINGEG